VVETGDKVEPEQEVYPALRQYSGEKARRYDSRRFASPRGRLTDGLEWLLLRRALARLRRSGRGVSSVLDVPIGTGRMAVRMTRRGINVTGVDASPDMLDVARSGGAARDYVVGRVECLPFEDLAFDVVVSVRLFGHLPPAAKAAALGEFRRVAREGAVVFFPGQTRWLQLRRAWQKRRGRPLRCWHPLSLVEARLLAREADFAVLCFLHLAGPFAETRAVVLLPA
jgi:SAM-dependent methyltransferase